MEDFDLDTSGLIHFPAEYAQEHGLLSFYRWRDLSSLTQGVVAAVFKDLDEQEGPMAWLRANRTQWAFTDLAPETLQEIIRDAAIAERDSALVGDGIYSADELRGAGIQFWRDRQRGRLLPKWASTTVTFDPDNKVRFHA